MAGGRIQGLGVLLLVRPALAKAGPKALRSGLCLGLDSWAVSGQGLGVVIFSKPYPTLLLINSLV